MICIFLSVVWAIDVTDVKVATSKESLGLSIGCEAFHVGVNFQRTEVHFWPENKDKISWIHYSDILYEKCENKCSSNAALCGEISESNASEVIIGACIEDLYIYIKASGKTSITIASNYLSEKCDHINENPYTQCGSMNYEECDRCGDNCRLAECIKEQRPNEKEKLIMNLCLPSNTSTSEVNEKCQGHINVDSGRWKQDCDDTIKIGNIGALTLIALVVTMMGFFGLFGVVFWYNWKMRINGVPPIKCCRLCPDMLFPRSSIATRQRLFESNTYNQ